MKAIVISEDYIVTKNFSSALIQNNFEVICYKWIIKAMDNIEEIQPDLVIIDVSAFPRHWKTLAQFLKSGISGKNTFYILYSPDCLVDDEQKKADFLGIDGMIDSLEIDQIADYIKSVCDNTNKSINSDLAMEKEIITTDQLFSVDSLMQNVEDAIEAKGYYVLTNPITGKFITGKYLEYDGKKITCEISNVDDFTGLEKDTNIKYISFANNNECKSFSATVNDYLDLLEEKFIILNVCDFYEEK